MADAESKASSLKPVAGGVAGARAGAGKDGSRGGPGPAHSGGSKGGPGDAKCRPPPPHPMAMDARELKAEAMGSSSDESRSFIAPIYCTKVAQLLRPVA